MFSSRFPWDLRPNRLSELLDAKRRLGTRLLDLTASNPTRVDLTYPGGEILEALAAPQALVYEPAPAGLPEARQAVADYYAERGQPVDPGRIILTTSTSEAYAYAFKLLADPGDQILAPRPSYPLFEFLAAMEAVHITPYPLLYDGEWSVDPGAVERLAGERARAIVLVNPNNPTGSFIKRHELAALLEVCHQRNLAIICDEVFADYAFGLDDRRIGTVVDVNETVTLCLSGLSKVAGLPQLKLGWIVAGGPEALLREVLQRLELIADTYLSVGAPVQHALARLLDAGRGVRGQILARVRENLAFLEQTLAGAAAQLLRPEGGWYATIRVPRTRTEEQWAAELLECDAVLVQPGFFYDFESEAFLVVSLLVQPEVFREGVRRLAARCG